MKDDDIEQILDRVAQDASRSLGTRQLTALVRDHWAGLFAIQAHGFTWGRIAEALSKRLAQKNLQPISEGTLKKLCHRARTEAQGKGPSQQTASPHLSQPVAENPEESQPSSETPASPSSLIERTSRQIGRRAHLLDFLGNPDRKP